MLDAETGFTNIVARMRQQQAELEQLWRCWDQAMDEVRADLPDGLWQSLTRWKLHVGEMQTTLAGDLAGLQGLLPLLKRHAQRQEAEPVLLPHPLMHGPEPAWLSEDTL